MVLRNLFKKSEKVIILKSSEPSETVGLRIEIDMD
jgi:hypothetical protein